MALAVKLNKKYTYADYLTWPAEERWELIEGVPYDMSPAPSPGHQEVLVSLVLLLGPFFKSKPCRIYPAPFDVRFGNTSDEKIETVLQPDLSIVCDKSKIDKKGCNGAPDLVVEILSPSTAYKDQTEKLKLYEKYGVKEYWIVNPETQVIQVFVYNGSFFEKPGYYRAEDSFASSVFSGLEISLPEVFTANQE